MHDKKLCRMAAISGRRDDSMQIDSSPDIFKLNIDCFGEIFEYLSFHDLVSFAKTCKRMQKVAGYFYQLNYKSKRIDAEHGGENILYNYMYIYSPYFEKISISGDNLKVFSFVASNCRSIKEMRLGECLPYGAIKCLSGILEKVKVLELNECYFNEEFHDYLLNYCPKLTSLSVKRSQKTENNSVIIGSGNEWLLRKYPTLEHLELVGLSDLQVDELNIFFQQNPNLRTFSTDSRSLWVNQRLLLTCAAKLDKLAIEISSQGITDPIHNLLAELNEKGFYNRLHVYSTLNVQNHLDQIFLLPSLSRSVEFFHGSFTQINNSLNNLISLSLNNVFEISNIHILPSKLPNLQQIYFSEAMIEHILPFIQCSVKLKRIKALRMVYPGGIYHLMQFPCLEELKERKKLAGARKVTIYIPERLILRAKLLHMKMRLSLVEIRQFDSFEWVDLNANFRHDHSKDYF